MQLIKEERVVLRRTHLLVNERKAGIQTVGDGSGTLGAAGIRGDDDNLVDVPILSDPAKDRRLGVEVVAGYREETLDLRGVEVHGDDVVGAGGLDHVGDQAGRDGGARAVLLVLAGVGEAGDDGGDAAGAGGPAGVDHDEHLHETLVDIAGGGRLEDVDVLIADRFANGDRGLLVRVVEGDGPGDFDAEAG